MELMDIADQIEIKIKEIDDIRRVIRKRGGDKATAVAEYEKAIALICIQLKNGKEFEFEGEKIYNPPVTIIEKLAKGICFEAKLAMETAEAMYKSALVNLECLQSQLTAYQSLFKHLDLK